MATRGKRSRKTSPARKARRPAPRKSAGRSRATRRGGARTRSARTAAAGSRTTARRNAPAMRSALRPIARMAAGWSPLRVVWRPAIAMATLPYRVYRVYRWAEAESDRSRGAGSVPTAY